MRPPVISLTQSTLPRWRRDPDSPATLELPRGGVRSVLVAEEAVHRRPRARHVGTEGAERAQLSRVRRAREVVRRQVHEVVRLERREETRAPVVEATRALALVERAVDVGGGGLRLAGRQEEDDVVVLRQVERVERGAVARAELRPLREEERNVRAERRGEE